MNVISNYFRSTCYSISSVILLIIISIIYIRKGKIGHKASTVFFALITIAFFICFSNFAFAYTFAHYDINSSINVIISRIYFLFLLLWPFTLLLYMIVYIYEKKNSKMSIFVRIILTVFLFAIMLAAYVLDYTPIVDLNRSIFYRGVLYNTFTIENILVSSFIVFLAVKYRNIFSNINLDPPIFIFTLYIIIITAEYYIDFEINYTPFFAGILIACFYFTTESQDALLLNNYNDAIKETNTAVKAKMNFLTGISTEIRSNLSHGLGYTQILKKNEDNNIENIKNNVIKIKKSNEKTKYIIDSLFDITNIENNKFEPKNSIYNIREVLDLVKYSVLDEINSYIYFDIDIKGNVPDYLYGDSEIVRKILFSSILNAATFVKNNGKIIVDVESQNMADEAVIIFNIFVNGDLLVNDSFDYDYNDYINKITNNDISGLKIGFVAAKKLINVLKGEIKYKSTDANNEIYVITFKQEIPNSRVGDK